MPAENLPVTEECVADLPPQCPHCNSVTGRIKTSH
jgi:hypothetical protein